MKCQFKRTTIDFGPRGGIKSKTWRCSREGKHLFQDTDCLGQEVGEVCLCTQHLKIANAVRNQKQKNESTASG